MQYYAFYDGQKHGPFTLEQLAAQQLPADAKIWRKGLSGWLSPHEVPELRDQIQTMPPPDPIPANPPARTAVQSQSRSGGATTSTPVAPVQPPMVDKAKGVLTNPQLPSMANWVCIYAIVASPLLWLFSKGTCCVSGLTFNQDSPLAALEVLVHFVSVPIELVAVILLVIGGLRLRDLRQSAVKLLKIGLWIDIATMAVGLLLAVFALLAAMASPTDVVAESSTAADVLTALSLPVSLAAAVFEVIAIVWLYKHSKELPLAQP